METMNENNQIIIYQTEDGQTQVDVRMENETVWLTQAQMAELFQKDRTVITRHINNVFKEGELNREEVCAKIAHTTRHGAMEGKTQVQEVVFYNLDVIISVGYRVKKPARRTIPQMGQQDSERIPGERLCSERPSPSRPVGRASPVGASGGPYSPKSGHYSRGRRASPF